MTEETGKALFNKQIQEICDQVKVLRHDAFPRWICQNILGIMDDGNVDEAVSIGGKNDYGVDVFHADEGGDVTEQYICWIQAKFSENLDRRISREEMESFASTFGHLQDCPKQANMTFKQKSSEFLKINEKHPRIKKRMIFAVTGRLTSQAEELVNNDRWKEERFGRDHNVSLEILDMNAILSRMIVPHTPTVKIRFDGNTITRSDVKTGKKSVLGYTSADSLIELTKRHKETLFLENPRQALGTAAPTHRAILNTLRNPESRGRFWKLNNGITAICSNFNSDESSVYSIENFKIVNGRQTIYTLERSTHPTDDVFLLMTIHEAVNSDERNQISEATNTQNPIKPIDLITNYPEMTELALQCEKDFPDFYFERQTEGFKSASQPVRNRVTDKRIMKKDSVARTYYAYAIDPNGSTMTQKVFFSGNSNPNYYEQVFKNRNIRDMIIPHIFMQMLDALHRKWCCELTDNPSEEVSRNKGIISKNIVKYYILRFIYESMLSIDDSKRESVKDKIIEIFRKLQRNDPIPDTFLDIAQSAYDVFMFSFDSDKNQTWPKDLLEQIKNKQPKNVYDMPSPIDIMHMLKQKGSELLPHLLLMRKHILAQHGDQVKSNILRLDPTV